MESAARLKFQNAVAKAFGAERKSVVVHRQDLGIASTDFSSRRLNEVFAFRAEIKDRGLTIYGCNTAAPGDPAFTKNPDGLAPLMKAARVLEEANALPVADVVSLVAWINQEFGSPLDPRAATLERSDAGVVLSYLSRLSQGPHSGKTMKVTVKVKPNHATEVTGEEARVE